MGHKKLPYIVFSVENTIFNDKQKYIDGNEINASEKIYNINYIKELPTMENTLKHGEIISQTKKAV